MGRHRAPSRPPCVLVVNDDRDACEMLVRMIGPGGFRAIGATSDVEAIWRCSSATSPAASCST